MPQANTVELRPAWTFICDNCGRTNFLAAPAAELTDDEREEIGEATGEAPGSFALHELPGDVRCGACQAVFATEVAVPEA